MQLARPRWGNLLDLLPDHGTMMQLKFQNGAI